MVHSMDRLARNLDDLRRIVQDLTRRGVRVEFVKEGLTFTGEDSPMANLMLSVMGAFAEFERALLRERQRTVSCTDANTSACIAAYPARSIRRSQGGPPRRETLIKPSGMEKATEPRPSAGGYGSSP